MYDKSKRMKKREERLIKKAHLDALEGITKEEYSNYIRYGRHSYEETMTHQNGFIPYKKEKASK